LAVRRRPDSPIRKTRAAWSFRYQTIPGGLSRRSTGSLSSLLVRNALVVPPALKRRSSPGLRRLTGRCSDSDLPGPSSRFDRSLIPKIVSDTRGSSHRLLSRNRHVAVCWYLSRGSTGSVTPRIQLPDRRIAGLFGPHRET